MDEWVDQKVLGFICEDEWEGVEVDIVTWKQRRIKLVDSWRELQVLA